MQGRILEYFGPKTDRNRIEGPYDRGFYLVGNGKFCTFAYLLFAAGKIGTTGKIGKKTSAPSAAHLHYNPKEGRTKKIPPQP